MYKIRNFISKLKRAWRFGKHGWKHPAWYEDYEFFNTILFSLDELILHFEGYDLDFFGNLKEDVKWIKLCKKLIEMNLNEHYIIPLHGKDYNEEEFSEAIEKDSRCLNLAMKIIAEKGRGWWI